MERGAARNIHEPAPHGTPPIGPNDRETVSDDIRVCRHHHRPMPVVSNICSAEDGERVSLVEEKHSGWRKGRAHGFILKH